MVELPRHRDASFEPRVVPKHARSFDGFDEQILALYASGMTTRETSGTCASCTASRSPTG
jgi:putative transposase